jgi:hypothetical protein
MIARPTPRAPAPADHLELALILLEEAESKVRAAEAHLDAAGFDTSVLCRIRSAVSLGVARARRNAWRMAPLQGVRRGS